METLSPETVSGGLTALPSTLSPPLCLAGSDLAPSPSILPPIPQDSPPSPCLPLRKKRHSPLRTLSCWIRGSWSS